MKFVDVPDSKRIERDPDNRNIVFSDGKITQDDVEIKKIELLEYKINTDQNLGTYSIITALVDTDQGLIEILYDEGYRGDDRSEEHTSELQSLVNLVCRLLLEKKKKKNISSDSR